MRIKEIVKGKVFSKSRFNNTFNDFRYKREIRNETVVRELVLIKIRFFKQRRYCRLLKTGWNTPELRDRLTMLVIVGTRTEAHFLRSQVGIRSESHCLLGKLRRILEISYSVAGLKVQKLGGVVDGAGE